MRMSLFPSFQEALCQDKTYHVPCWNKEVVWMRSWEAHLGDTVEWWWYELYLIFFIDSIFVNGFIIRCMDSPDMILEALKLAAPNWLTDRLEGIMWCRSRGLCKSTTELWSYKYKGHTTKCTNWKVDMMVTRYSKQAYEEWKGIEHG